MHAFHNYVTESTRETHRDWTSIWHASYINIMCAELEAEDVDVLVKGIHVHIQKQQKEIRMKIGRVLGLSEKNTLKELLNDWVMKSEGATLNELTHALDQVGLGNELSINMPQGKLCNTL